MYVSDIKETLWYDIDRWGMKIPSRVPLGQCGLPYITSPGRRRRREVEEEEDEEEEKEEKKEEAE